MVIAWREPIGAAEHAERSRSTCDYRAPQDRPICLAQLSQPAEVRRDAGEERRVRVVRHAKLTAGLLDDLRDRRVVDVTDAREQVMFDLEVEPAEQPRSEPA